MSKALLWQRAGYVSKDVWNEMDKIVSKDLLPSQQEINDKSEVVPDFEEEAEKVHVTDKIKKLGEGDTISTTDIIFVVLPTVCIHPKGSSSP